MTPASRGGDVRSWIPNDFAARCLLKWTRLLAAHRWMLAAILLLQAIVFSSLSAWIAWQPDVLLFFSADSAEVRNVRQAAQQPGLANQLRFDVHMNGASGGKGAVEAAAGELAAALRADGQFRSVWTGADPADMAASYATLMNQAPLLLTDEERAEVEKHLTPDYLQQRFATAKQRLADPDGELLLRQLASDPLNLSQIITSRLQSLSPASAAGPASFHDGLLMTQAGDGHWHAMIVTEPVSLPSDQKAAETTLAAASAAIASVAKTYPGVDVWMVGAHRGYVENAKRIVTDVSWVSMIGTLAVGIAIALYFKRISTALLCMIPPVVGVGLALGLAGIFHVTLPLLLLGFAGLLCGSTTDYGIQIIAECRRLFMRNAGRWDADIPAVAARRMLGPISMSVATSVTGFSALLLSAAPGLRMMGLFVASATVCIWLVTFLILPACLGPWIMPRKDPPKSELRAPWRIAFWAGGAIFCAVTIWMVVGALHVRFNADPRSLDGSPASLRSEENDFAEVWGDPRNHAIVLVNGHTAEEALVALGHVNDYLQDQQRDGLISHVTSPAAILPDQALMDARAKSWADFWTAERVENLRADLSAAATANGFKAPMFAEYANHVAKVASMKADERLAESPAKMLPGFVEKSPAGITLASIVQMRSDVSLRRATAWAPELRSRFPETVILAGNVLFFDATERARAEGERLLPWCILAILIPLVIYFRRLTRAWLVMTCLLAGLLWVLGAASYFGGGLNLLSLVPVMFTLGVAVDYGIYLSSQPKGEDARGGATGMCALTTILGSGALLLAGHPAMRWLGMTLVAGVSGGILAAVFVVWPLARWGQRDRVKHGAFRWLGWAVVNAGLLVLTIALLVPIVAERVMAKQAPEGATAKRAYPILQQTGRRAFQIGESSMRWRETGGGSGIWEIKLTGGPFERGHAVAQLALPLDFRIETEMLEQLDSFLPQEWARWLVLRGVGTNMVALPHYVKEEYQQEIWASAMGAPDPHDYLAPSYPRILSYHALHDVSQMLIDNPLIVPNSFACTGVVSLPAYSAARDGHLLLARNFDFEGGESFGRQKSVTYITPPAGDGIAFMHVAWPGLAGCVTGMNADHIALFLNAAATQDFRRIGTPTILMARDILQHAHSIADAEKIIRFTDVFVSDIIIVADGKTGESRVFEKSPAATDFYDVKDSTVVTNHLVTARFKDDPVNQERMADGTTSQRYARARELLDGMKGQVTTDALVELLRDKKGAGGKNIGLGNRNAIDGLIACHGVVMDVTAGEMWVGGWPNVEGGFLRFTLNANDDNPKLISADKMMNDGEWERWMASKVAERAGLEALHARDMKAARAFAEKEVADNPDFYFGHELLGRVMMNAGDLAAARKEFLRASELDPPYAKRRTEIEQLLKKCETAK